MTRHRTWILFLLLAIALGFASNPLAVRLDDAMKKKTEKLVREGKELSAQVRQWRADMHEAESLSRTIDAAEVEHYLAPADRNALAEKLEPLAVAAGLEAFTFELAPAEAYKADTDFPTLENVTQSLLSVSFEAPHDAAAFDFLKALGTLPGRMEIRELDMKRFDATRALATRNVHASAKIVWLANGKEVVP